MRTRLAFLATGWAGLQALAACSAGGGGAVGTAPAAAAMANPPVPASFQCADGLTSTRSNSSTAVYAGSVANDPGMCVATINGRRTLGYLGVVGPSVSPEARAAIIKIVEGVPGTKVSFAGPNEMAWTISVIDRNDYSFNGKSYPAVHYSFVFGSVQGQVWMDAENGMFFRYAASDANWVITSLHSSGA